MAGYKPVRENLILSRGADFVHMYKKDPKDPAFPDGTTAEIVVTDGTDMDATVLATWLADDVSEEAISFWVQSPDADAIDDRVNYRLLVHYPPPIPDAEQQDFVWFYGSVRRIQ